MVLSDLDLQHILEQMNFETDDTTRPFDANAQVQPCSIDLRVDRIFWLARKPFYGKRIDLRRTASGEMEMQRLFRVQYYHAGDGITINPGQMVMGRTFEKFTIPNGYAGKLEARSSYARMGLSIHCTGDFINPGWRGHMPLQLVNHSHVPIVLTPYAQIAQVLVIKTSGESIKPYGTEATTGHKYNDDDGGPSKYWRDASLQNLLIALGQRNLPEHMQSEFLRIIGRDDAERMDRFVNFIGKLRAKDFTSEREVLERFAKQDERSYCLKKRLVTFLKWFCLVPVSTAVGAILRPFPGRLNVWLWVVTAVLLVPGLWALLFAKEPDGPFTSNDLEKAFAKP
jgi:deoxycytidine triphosphate deaminase